MKQAYMIFAALAAATPAMATIHTAATLREAVYGNFAPSEFSITGHVSFVRLASDGYPSAVGVEDSSGGIIVFPADDKIWDGRLKTGDIAAFSGRVELDRGKKPCARMAIHNFIAHGAPVEPADVNAADLLDGKHDFQRVRLSGILRDATGSETNPLWTMLVIYDGRNRVFASVPTTADESHGMRKMIGERVSLTGYCVPDDLSPRLRIGRIILVAKPSDIANAATTTTTVADMPDIGRIRYGNATDVEALEAHRATGCIVAVCRNRRAVLRMEDGDFVGIDFADGPMPRYGDVVTAWGLPESDLFHLHLTNAKWRKADGEFIEEPPVAASPRSMIADKNGNAQVNSHLYGRPIMFEGIVRSVSSDNAESRLVHVESDSTLVTIDATSLPSVLDDIPIGSRVAVTGVCIIDQETPRSSSSFPKIGHFSVALRKPEDLVVLARPSWWTAARLWGAIGALFAALVAIFIWNVALRKAATRKGRELLRAELAQTKADLKTEERTRLAVELHDSVAQMLTGISMEIEAARGIGEAAPPEMLAHIDIAGKALKSCRDELRNCLWDLRSQALEEKDMAKAVTRTLQPHVNDSRLCVRFDMPRTALDDNTAHALLRIIRELVTNAIRHGEATRVEVAGALDKASISCSVTDNGHGFDPENCPSVFQGHFGLAGVRERLRPLHGTMKIDSRKGVGTRICISIPRQET